MMPNDISIAISGNPVSGISPVGNIGPVLSEFDPNWPYGVKGDYAIIIKDDTNYSYYCLSINSALINSQYGSRGGALNFQFRIPSNSKLVGLDGKEIDPATFLLNLFSIYEKNHLKSIDNVRGWIFEDNYKMSDDELRSFLSSYRLESHPVPSRRLTGEKEGVLILTEEKIKAFTLDHAYPEITQYGKLWLSTKGETTPTELSKLEIPRTHRYDVYINGVKQAYTITKDQEPRKETITPSCTWKNPKEITIDFANGKVSEAEERIYFDVEFEDKVVTKNIKIELDGLEQDKEKTKIIRTIRDSISVKLKNGIYTIKGENKTDDTKHYVFKGQQIDTNWNYSYDNLPETVKFIREKKEDDYLILVFKYEKPKSTTSNYDRGYDNKKNHENNGSGNDKNKLNIYFILKDEKFSDELVDKKFDVSIKNDEYSFSVWNNKIDGGCKKCKLPDGKEISAYEKEFILPKSVELKSSNKIIVKSRDEHFVMSVDKTKKEYIIVSVTHLSKFQLLQKKDVFSKLAFLLIVFALGWFIGEFFTPISSVVDFVTKPDTPVETENQGEVDAHEEDNILALKSEEGSADPVPEEEVIETEILEGTAEVSPENGVAGNTLSPEQKNELNKEADGYFKGINDATLTFDDVDNIEKWINNNKTFDNSITNYNEIRTAIEHYKKCINVLNKINTESINNDIDNLVDEIRKIGFNIPNDGKMKMLLYKLRILMQKFYIKGSDVQNKHYTKDKIYNFNDKRNRLEESKKKSFEELNKLEF